MRLTKKKTRLIIALTAFILIVIYGLFILSKSRTFQFFGELIYRVEAKEKVIALTFDDAPTEYTTEVLETLNRYQVKATFYAIGTYMEKYPELTTSIVEQGHELGNHTYSHQRMILKSQTFIDQEIQKTNNLIRKAGYLGEITFRPPTGKKLLGLPWYLNQHNIKTIMWDVEPDTFVPGDAEKITEYTLKNTKPGSIILLHPFCKTECKADREALPKIISKLQEQGYKFVTVSELLVIAN